MGTVTLIARSAIRVTVPKILQEVVGVFGLQP